MTTRKRPTAPAKPASAKLTQEQLDAEFRAILEKYSAGMAIQILSPLGQPLPIDAFLLPGITIRAWPQIQEPDEE